MSKVTILSKPNRIVIASKGVQGPPGPEPVQVSTFVLPGTPTVGQVTKVLADSTTVFPGGLTWDEDGPPVLADERRLIACVWGGEDWACTYGPPILPAPSRIGPEWDATFTVGTPAETTVEVTASAPATDNVGVTGYQVSYDGGESSDPIGAIGLTFTLSGAGGVTYNDTALRAVDGDGNVSPWLNVPSYTMAPSTDSDPPVWDATLSIGTAGHGSIEVTPSALATDAYGVTGYEATLDHAADPVEWYSIGLPVGGVLNVDRLRAETAYDNVALRARDAAGLVSASLPVPAFTTSAAPAPPNIGQLAEYWADDIAAADGSILPTWVDRDSLYPATGPAGRQPTFRVSDPEFGGAPVVDFSADGSPYLLSGQWTQNVGAFYFVVVGTWPLVLGEQSFLLGGWDSNRHNVYRHPNSPAAGVYFRSISAAYSGTTEPADGKPHLMCAVFDGANSKYIMDEAVYPLAIEALSSTGITIGAGESSGNRNPTFRFRGKIAYLAYMDGVPSEGDLSAIRAWVAERYGL